MTYIIAYLFLGGMSLSLIGILIAIMLDWYSTYTFEKQRKKEEQEAFVKSLEEEKRKGESDARQALVNAYFDTPLSRIGMNLIDGTTVYSSPIKHHGWYSKETFSSHIAKVRIVNPSIDIFEDDKGVFYPRASIKSFFIETTDWWMGYGENIRKRDKEL